MNIYNKLKPILPYVYRCVEKNTGNFYIGYRFKNTVPRARNTIQKHIGNLGNISPGS